MKKYLFFFAILSLALCGHTFGQQDDRVDITDDIQIDVKSIQLDANNDTLTVELFLISYQMDPREFKLNVYATQLVDKKGESHLFGSITMGRVRVVIEDRQNYLHYLIEENEPVPFTLKVPGWGDREVEKLAVVFEDSAEEGRFITHHVNLVDFTVAND